MVFLDLPACVDIGRLNTRSSGIYYERRGSAMDDVAREALWEVERYPALQALWTSTPLQSMIGSFDAQQRAAYLAWRARHG